MSRQQRCSGSCSVPIERRTAASGCPSGKLQSQRRLSESSDVTDISLSSHDVGSENTAPSSLQLQIQKDVGIVLRQLVGEFDVFAWRQVDGKDAIRRAGVEAGAAELSRVEAVAMVELMATGRAQGA